MITYEQALSVQREVSAVLFKFEGYDSVAVGRDHPLQGNFKVIVVSSDSEPEGYDLPTEIDGVQIEYNWNCTGPYQKSIACPN